MAPRRHRREALPDATCPVNKQCSGLGTALSGKPQLNLINPQKECLQGAASFARGGVRLIGKHLTEALYRWATFPRPVSGTPHAYTPCMRAETQRLQSAARGVAVLLIVRLNIAHSAVCIPHPPVVYNSERRVGALMRSRATRAVGCATEQCGGQVS